MRILICISGASGAKLALKLAKFLNKEHKVYVVFSKGAKLVLKHEEGLNIKKYLKKHKITYFKDSNLAASVSSGSFLIDCAFFYASCDFLANVLYGRTNTLITRAFNVNLKENRKIIIAPRESPFSSIMLKNLKKLNSLGCIIAPALISTYSKSKQSDFMIGKWCDLIGIKHNLFKRWEGK